MKSITKASTISASPNLKSERKKSLDIKRKKVAYMCCKL